MPSPKARQFRSEARGRAELDGVFARLGARLAQLRAEHGLSQEDLARLAFIDPKHVQNLEHGRSNPTVATLAGLARGLDVPIAELFRDV